LINFLFAVEVESKTNVLNKNIMQENKSIKQKKKDKIITLEEALKKILKDIQSEKQQIENNISIPEENESNITKEYFTKSS